MKITKLFVSFLLIFTLFFTGFAIETYNGGDFLITFDKLSDSVYNDNINSQFKFSIKNIDSKILKYNVNIDNVSGWDIIYDSNIVLKPGQTKDIYIDFVSNSDFDFSSSVISSDIIKITQNEDYSGIFEFPILINSDKNINNSISLKYTIQILEKEKLPVKYITKISTGDISPKSSLKYTIYAKNLETVQTVNIQLLLDDKILNDFNEVFSLSNNYKIFSQDISTELVPGIYNLKIIIKLSDDEGKYTIWEESKKILILKYSNLKEELTFKKSLLKDIYEIHLHNFGNVKEIYDKELEMGIVKYLFFGSNYDYKNTDNGIKFDLELAPSEDKVLIYYFSYLGIYIILFIFLLLIIYVYYRKNSNPLDVETKIYEIKTVVYEGVKSLKIRIGFENIKESQIDDIKIVFRMPIYLNIKDNSFLLSEPKKVLKGKSQYKLIWEFKNFEKNDSRILGFALINNKGILGDIKLPDLEIEIKIKGKIRKYYKSFQTIKG